MKNKPKISKAKVANINFDDLVAKTMTPESIERSDIQASEMRLEELLFQMRERSGLTQAGLAKKLDIKPPSLCKMEKGNDMLLSTLGRIVGAMNGELDLHVTLKSGEKIVVKKFGHYGAYTTTRSATRKRTLQKA